MKTTNILIISATILAISTIIYMIPSSNQSSAVKQQFYSLVDTNCTESLGVECAVDIQRTIKACATAFETQGTDIIADIKCAKDLLADKKHCWPCICFQAQKRGWHIIGC